MSKFEKRSILTKFSINIAPANFFAILILLNGLVITVETLTQRFRARFDIFYQIVPVDIHYYRRIISAVIGISLIYLSINLFSKKNWLISSHSPFFLPMPFWILTFTI